MADDENPELDLADVIRDLAHGASNKQGSAKLAELIRACATTGKKGVLTLKLGIAVDPATKIAQIVGQFTTSEGGIVTEDPRQLKLPVTRLPDSKIVNINSTNGGKAG